MGKTVIWKILSFPPLLPLNNVEEQWAELLSSNVFVLQDHIAWDGEV